MKHYLKKEELKTKEHSMIYDITDVIFRNVSKSRIKSGHVLIQPLHTTVGIYINEGEPRLLTDFIMHLCNAAPEIKGRYLHDDLEKRDCPKDEPLNGHSHIKSSLYSNPSVSLVLFNGILQIGKYQRILFAEFDGPCPRNHKEKRNYFVSIIGE